MHQTADVIAVVADAESPVNGVSKLACGPAVARETVCNGTIAIHAANAIDLVCRETAGASGGAAFSKRLNTFLDD